MKGKFLGMAAIAVGCIALAPGYAAACTGSDPLTCDGVTYTLTAGTPTQMTSGGSTFYVDTFELGITGINGPSDTEAKLGATPPSGRFGIESVAFNQTAGFVGAISPWGFAQAGGLNAGGCDGSGASFFCFENTSAITQKVLPADSSLTFDFAVGASTAADLTGWDPDFKIAWDGTKSRGCAWASTTTAKCDTDGFHSGYDLVSHALPPKPAAAPEIDPASATGALTLLIGGLATLRGRRRKAA